METNKKGIIEKSFQQKIFEKCQSNLFCTNNKAEFWHKILLMFRLLDLRELIKICCELRRVSHVFNFNSYTYQQGGA